MPNAIVATTTCRTATWHEHSMHDAAIRAALFSLYVKPIIRLLPCSGNTFHYCFNNSIFVGTVGSIDVAALLIRTLASAHPALLCMSVSQKAHRACTSGSASCMSACWEDTLRMHRALWEHLQLAAAPAVLYVDALRRRHAGVVVLCAQAALLLHHQHSHTRLVRVLSSV